MKISLTFSKAAELAFSENPAKATMYFGRTGGMWSPARCKFVDRLFKFRDEVLLDTAVTEFRRSARFLEVVDAFDELVAEGVEEDAEEQGIDVDQAHQDLARYSMTEAPDFVIAR